MNILITGSSGFLGKEVVKLLHKNKYKLSFLVRNKNKKKNNFYCNLKNQNNIKKILNKINPDVIINLAAEVNFIEKTRDMYKVNAYAPYEIARFCKKKQIHLIQASGTIVHGVKKIYSKRTKLSPINDYGKSKLKGDLFIKKINCKHTILRFGGIYGKNGPKHLGLNKFINLALKKKIIKFNGNKKSKRNYIFVKDAAKIILFCIKNKKFGTFYIGGKTLSFKEMLKKISLILTKKQNIIFTNVNHKLDNQIVKNDRIVKITSFAQSLKLIK